MKPSSSTWAPVYEYLPDGTIREYGQEVQRFQYVSGVNNKNRRPVSGYSARYYDADYGIRSTGYNSDGTVSSSIVGPMNHGHMFNWHMVQDGSLRIAQNKLHSQFLNVTMLARDLYDANKLAQGYFGRVSKCIKFLRKRKFNDAYKAFMGTGRHTRGAANNWLEFQFGVLPTIRAVQDSYSAFSLSNRALHNCNFLRLTSSSQKVYKSSGSDSYTVYIPGKDCTIYRCGRYFTRDTIFDSLFRVNPVEAAWDMIPYSFLVDWFIPVGDWLKQFGYITQYSTDGWDAIKQTVTKSGYGISYWYGTSQPLAVHHANSEEVSFQRFRNNAVDYDLSISEMLNRSRLGVSCGQTVTAFALARQRANSIKW